MPFWLIHVCSVLGSGFAPPNCLWEVAISAPRQVGILENIKLVVNHLLFWFKIYRYQFPGCKFCSQKNPFILQNLMPCNKSQGHGLWSDRGQCLWQTSEYKQIKGPSLLKCPGKIDSANQSVTWTTSELTSLEKKKKNPQQKSYLY